MELSERYRSECKIWNRWLYLSHNGITLLSHEALRNKRFAIYGLGDIGKRLLEECDLSGALPEYIVDRCAKQFFIDKLVIEPEGKLPDADVMVVTVIFDWQEIFDHLNGRFFGEIIRIDTLVNELWMKRLDQEMKTQGNG